MTIEEIKQFLKENEENQEVQRFVESLADRRVTQARQKWEVELQAKVEAELETRAKAETEAKEQKARLQAMLNDRLEKDKIDLDLASEFLPETFQEDDIDQIVQSVSEKVTKIHSKIIKNTYGHEPPKRITESNSFRDQVLSKVLKG